jgi:hypothetical protein
VSSLHSLENELFNFALYWIRSLVFVSAAAGTSESMADAKTDQISGGEQWYLYRPSKQSEGGVDVEMPIQPYRSAPTTWPLSAEELSRTERLAQSCNPSALNNLGTAHTQSSGCISLVHFCVHDKVRRPLDGRCNASVWLGPAHQPLQSLYVLLPCVLCPLSRRRS